MSTAQGETETAFSLAEVLNQTMEEREEMGDYMEAPYPEGLVANWSLSDKVLRIGNATWVPRLIDSDMLAAIEGFLKETPLYVRRNAYARSVTLVTPGVLNGLKDKVQVQIAENESRTDGQYPTVGVDTYGEMVREGVVDWTIRTAADEDYELRGCAQCGKWFEPTLKARSRFCSTKCRKEFNNLRNGAGADYATFTCAGCEESRPMEEFAGLSFTVKDSPVTPLRIAKYALAGKDMCCVHCVRAKYKEWRRYIAPMETLSERVSS